MSQVREYDFELVVFKFENLFYTTKALFHKLQETVSSRLPKIRFKKLSSYLESDKLECPRYKSAFLQEEGKPSANSHFWIHDEVQ